MGTSSVPIDPLARPVEPFGVGADRLHVPVNAVGLSIALLDVPVDPLDVPGGPRCGSVLPRRGSIDPRWRSVLPRRGPIDPHWGSALPRQGSIDPHWGSVLPRAGSLGTSPLPSSPSSGSTKNETSHHGSIASHIHAVASTRRKSALPAFGWLRTDDNGSGTAGLRCVGRGGRATLVDPQRKRQDAGSARVRRKGGWIGRRAARRAEGRAR